MKKRTPISKIMSTDILTVNLTQTLKEVNDILKTKHVRHVPVVSGKKVLGMLSSTDIQKISFINTVDGENLTTEMFDVLTLDQVMSKNLETMQEEDTIYDAAVLLSTKDFHAIPVLKGEDLVGIVTSTDLLKYLVEQF
ncbi:MAG: CBS domain-containing protein [Crocinitomicaceae bacterium]